ncbi:MAG: tyrosine-protein phosphatase [Acidobacteriia bacterium]|nr:tyrosine-protein phosphatase [Terriglobia bacterium]
MMEMQGQPLTSPLGNVPRDSVGLKKALRLASAVALLAGTMSLAEQTQRPEAAPASSEAKHAIARKLTLPGVPRFGEVTPTLYRGAQPTPEGFSNLAKMGINIVVDLRGSRDSERRLVSRLGMRYVPLHWQCFSPRDEHFAQFLTLLRENPGKKVFVHCRVGDDRTGMDIAAYRIAEQGWAAEEARKEMEAYGVNWFHKAICFPLSSYEKEFPERFKTSAAFESLRSAKHAPEPQP